MREKNARERNIKEPMKEAQGREKGQQPKMGGDQKKKA